MKIVEIDGINQLQKAAQAIISELNGRNIVAFYGQMGAGKTTLITSICELLGVEQRVTSPTFALVNEYESGDGFPIYHFDLYRIERIEELFDMGYEEYFYGEGLSLIEWPERIDGILPEDTMRVEIEVLSPTSRRFKIFD